jgi:tripartite ATP-independent transporter DctM subunit
MGLPELLAVAMVVALCVMLMAGYPVALTLGGVAFAFALVGHALGVMDLTLLRALPQRVFGVMANEVLIAIPLFVFMGVTLERSGLAEDLLETMGRLFGARAGGLAVAVVLVGVLLAAAKGIVGATVVTMGLIVLPSMVRHGYDPRLAAGTVAATATLAQVFPPATVLVLLGDQISNAFTAAQLAKGSFSPAPVTVSDLFAGAILPAVALVLLYLMFVVAVAVIWPKSSPPVRSEPGAPRGFALARRLVEVLFAPLLLILIVLGSILAGIATPTESAAIGAVGAIILAVRRSQALLFMTQVLRPVLHRTAHITSMIFVILIGATLFSLVFRGLGGDDMVQRALSDLPGGTAGAVLAVMLAMFLLGFVMDAFEIIFVVVPIVAPPLLAMPGVNPVWLGVMMALNLQTSYLHPPLGPTLFYLRGVAPAEITTAHIYVGVIPFVLMQFLALVVLWFVPGLATFLPRALYGG